MIKASVIVLAASMLLVACPAKKSSTAATPAAKAAPAKAAPAAPAKTAGLALKKLGLTIALPADSNVTDMGDSTMIQGGGTVVNVGVAGASDPKDFAEAEKGMKDYSPTKVGEKTKTADGWVITFENKGGMGTNYFAWVRRTIGGKQIKCETTASTADQQAKAVAACKSLTKG